MITEHPRPDIRFSSFPPPVSLLGPPEPTDVCDSWDRAAGGLELPRPLAGLAYLPFPSCLDLLRAPTRPAPSPLWSAHLHQPNLPQFVRKHHCVRRCHLTSATTPTEPAGKEVLGECAAARGTTCPPVPRRGWGVPLPRPAKHGKRQVSLCGASAVTLHK